VPPRHQARGAVGWGASLIACRTIRQRGRGGRGQTVVRRRCIEFLQGVYRSTAARAAAAGLYAPAAAAGGSGERIRDHRLPVGDAAQDGGTVTLVQVRRGSEQLGAACQLLDLALEGLTARDDRCVEVEV